jgi:hypothetical protein
MVRIASLTLILALAVGCGGTNPGGPPSVSGEASEAIVKARDLIIEASVGGIKFEKMADVKQLESQFPIGAEAIKNGTVIVVWGKKISEGIIAPPQIIAYESKVPTDGGWVLREDAKISKITADAFAAEAPKASPGQK